MRPRIQHCWKRLHHHETAWHSAPWGHCSLFHEAVMHRLDWPLGISWRLSVDLPAYILTIIYTALILPYLTYNIEIWYGAYNNMIELIFILQKEAVRCINALPYNHRTTNYFSSRHVQSLPELHKYFVVNFLYKYIISGRNIPGFTHYTLITMNIIPEMKCSMFSHGIISLNHSSPLGTEAYRFVERSFFLH